MSIYVIESDYDIGRKTMGRATRVWMDGIPLKDNMTFLPRSLEMVTFNTKTGYAIVLQPLGDKPEKIA